MTLKANSRIALLSWWFVGVAEAQIQAGFDPPVSITGTIGAQSVGIGYMKDTYPQYLRPQIISANGPNGTVSIFRCASMGYSLVTNLTAGRDSRMAYPRSIAILNSNTFFVANYDESTVDVMQCDSSNIYRSLFLLDVGTHPIAITCGNVGTAASPVYRAFTANFYDATVSAIGINLATHSFFLETNYPAGNSPKAVLLGNFLGNASPPNLLVLNSSDNNVSILVGDGSGKFLVPNPPLISPTGDNPVAMVVGSGFLFTANQGNQTLGVLKESASGIGLWVRTCEIPLDHMPVTMSGGDLNGDGKMDLVIGYGDENSIEIFLGTGADAPGYDPPSQPYFVSLKKIFLSGSVRSLFLQSLFTEFDQWARPPLDVILRLPDIVVTHGDMISVIPNQNIPRLNFRRAANQVVVGFNSGAFLTWPGLGRSYAMDSATTLTPVPDWHLLTKVFSPAAFGLGYESFDAITNGNKFYRLRRQ